MGRYIDAEKLISEIKRKIESIENCPFQLASFGEEKKNDGELIAYKDALSLIISLQQEQPEEQPEYGYLSTEYVHGKKSKWNVGDVLAYYICTSNEEGEYPLGKIINVKFDEEDGWVYTFEDGSVWDEQSLFEEEAYKKN